MKSPATPIRLPRRSFANRLSFRLSMVIRRHSSRVELSGATAPLAQPLLAVLGAYNLGGEKLKEDSRSYILCALFTIPSLCETREPHRPDRDAGRPPNNSSCAFRPRKFFRQARQSHRALRDASREWRAARGGRPHKAGNNGGRPPAQTYAATRSLRRLSFPPPDPLACPLTRDRASRDRVCAAPRQNEDRTPQAIPD